MSSNKFAFTYLVPFEMVIGIICKNVFTSKLLLFKLLLAMFRLACVVIWVYSCRDVSCLLLRLGIVQFILEGQGFNIWPFSQTVPV